MASDSDPALSGPYGAFEVTAVEYLKTLNGGSQAKLIRCSDGGCYVTKFPKNPQGSRILVNELIAGQLALRLKLPAPAVRIVKVDDELIRRSDGLAFELPHGKVSCRPGYCFGSEYPDAYRGLFYDSWPIFHLNEISNFLAFAGILAFDIWTSNTDLRQVRFFKYHADSMYQVMMVDNGNCFGQAKWRLTKISYLALYFKNYRQIDGIDSFEPWLSRIESAIDQELLSNLAKSVPPEWYEPNHDQLYKLLDELYARRSQVREMIWALRREYPSVFPNWKIGEKHGVDCSPPRLLQLQM